MDLEIVFRLQGESSAQPSFWKVFKPWVHKRVGEVQLALCGVSQGALVSCSSPQPEG